MNNYTRILFLIIYLALAITSSAQEPIYKHFGVDDGLPSSEVYDIYQDKEGYIWFATDKGLSRYNGYEFENFNTNDGLPGNVVLSFYPQANGQVWCYTFHNKTLFYFNDKFDGFTSYKYNVLLSQNLHKKSAIKSIFLDSLNNLHIGGFSINGELIINDCGGLSKKKESKDYFNNNNIQEIVLSNKLTNKTSSFHYTKLKSNVAGSKFTKAISKVSAHIQGEWIIANEKAVLMINKELQIIDNDNNTSILIKNKCTPLRIKVIDETQFFVGYHFGGVKILNAKGQIQKEYLKNKSVTNFLIDHEGGYWFTTLNSGVFYIKAPSVLVFQDSQIKTNSHISSLAKNAENELLVGYENGTFAKKTIDNSYTLNPSKTPEPAFVEYDTEHKKGYVFTERSIKDINDGVLMSNLYITKFSELKFNKSLLATTDDGYYNVGDGKTITTPFRVEDICVFGKDTLLAASHGVFKKAKDSITALSNKSHLLGYRSDDIDILNLNGDYVIATQGAGVVVYNEEFIYAISEIDGLTSNVVNEVHVENDSTIWACTNKGLNKITLSTNNYTVATIDKNNGLLSNELEDIEIINETLWIGTKLGLCYMPKELLDHKQQENIYFKLKTITINDIPYDEVNDELKLNYKENKITFLVEGLSFAQNNNLEYQYRLKEAGAIWNTTKSRSINFPNLSPGKYTFQAKVCINEANCSKNQLEYHFLISPPFWKTGWFYTLCLILLGGVIYMFFKIRVLTYNTNVARELIRLLIKHLKREEKFLEIRVNGEDIKLPSNEILYIKSSGNYLDIVTNSKTYTIRCKIGEFIATQSDVLEYLRVHRSYIIRIDQITGKSKNTVTIKEYVIPVGETYLKQLDKIQF